MATSFKRAKVELSWPGKGGTRAGQRKQYPAAFQAQVALAALEADQTANELVTQFGVHPTLIPTWKKQLLAGADPVFGNARQAAAADAEAQKAGLFEQIGRRQMELEWLKKKLPPSPEQRRALIEPGHPQLSVRRQCALLGLNRSTLYYEPAAETAENLRPMRLLDQEDTAQPFLGSRRLTAWQVEQGEAVNRKRVQRLLRLMGQGEAPEVVQIDGAALVGGNWASASARRSSCSSRSRRWLGGDWLAAPKEGFRSRGRLACRRRRPR